jgi:hypothetical protein
MLSSIALIHGVRRVRVLAESAGPKAPTVKSGACPTSNG